MGERDLRDIISSPSSPLNQLSEASLSHLILSKGNKIHLYDILPQDSLGEEGGRRELTSTSLIFCSYLYSHPSLHLITHLSFIRDIRGSRKMSLNMILIYLYIAKFLTTFSKTSFSLLLSS